MSRMRKLKNNKQSNLKSTIIGLALAIAIGTVGGIGSYAYFTDNAEAKNDLVVNMGDLSTSVSEGFNTSDGKLGPNGKKTKKITITNTGSLKQTAKLYIDVKEIDSKDKRLLSVTINEVGNTDVDPGKPENTFNLSDDNRTKFIDLGTIDPGKSKEKLVIVKSYDGKLTGDSVKFNLRVESEQKN